MLMKLHFGATLSIFILTLQVLHQDSWMQYGSKKWYNNNHNNYLLLGFSLRLTILLLQSTCPIIINFASSCSFFLFYLLFAAQLSTINTSYAYINKKKVSIKVKCGEEDWKETIEAYDMYAKTYNSYKECLILCKSTCSYRKREKKILQQLLLQN